MKVQNNIAGSTDEDLSTVERGVRSAAMKENISGSVDEVPNICSILNQNSFCNYLFQILLKLRAYHLA
jgi:hypothetical protein